MAELGDALGLQLVVDAVRLAAIGNHAAKIALVDGEEQCIGQQNEKKQCTHVFGMV